MRAPPALALGAVLLCGGCGGASAPAVVNAPATATPAVPAAPRSPAPRGPSEALLTHCAADDAGELALYVDFAGLSRTPLLQSLLAFLAASKDTFTGEQVQCLRDAMTSVQEVLILGRGPLTLVRFDEHAADPATTCLAAWGATPAHVEGVPDAYRLADEIVAHLPGLIVIGKETGVVKSVAPAAPWPAPPSLRLGDDQYVVWRVNTPDDSAIQLVTGGIVLSPSRFGINVDFDAREGVAEGIEDELRSVKEGAAPSGIGAEAVPMFKALLRAMTVKRDGKHVSVALDLQEPVEDQLNHLSIAIYGARRYIAHAKAAEARNTVVRISKDIVSSWAVDPGTKAQRGASTKKLASFAPVPKAVPRGAKYQSSPEDWKPWASIRFSMTDPQYFQYEVRAAKDGQSAEILARGDLNGDGKTSLFRLKVAVDPKDRTTLQVAPAVEETDPEE